MGQLGVRWAWWIGPAVAVVGLGWCGWRWWDVRRERDALARAEAAMQDGLYAVAARDLSALLNRKSGSDRAAYLLGLCEKARGREREADAAWARIAPDAPLGGRAIAGRLDLLLDRGRLADAEDLIGRATDGRGFDGTALRVLLIPTLVQEGRDREAARLIESRWRALDAKGEGASEQAVNLARLHMEMRWNTPPVDAIRAYLDHVGRLAPDDDRIRLGRANLALRTGSLEEAARWIGDCLHRRPDDPAVWRARLEWATRTSRPVDARDALKHLPAGSASGAEVHRLSAWFASTCGDAEGERRELAALVAEAPEDFEAMDRLRDLEQRGPGGPSTDRGQRKAQVERDQARYRALYRRNQPARDAEEMARLAERLGHPFEALVYQSAAIAEEPERDDLRAGLRRLEKATTTPAEAGRSLFDRLSISHLQPGDYGPRGSSRGRRPGHWRRVFRDRFPA